MKIFSNKIEHNGGAENNSKKIGQLKNALQSCDAVLIGAGAGLSAASGFYYDGERFEKYFEPWHKRFGIRDMYSGGFYPYKNLEQFWAWWFKAILVNRYECPAGKPYKDLLELVKDKNYFVITTNVDHQFQKSGFEKTRLFYTQGDYGLFQCSKTCCKKTYDNEKLVRKMASSINMETLEIPAELIPKCPACGEPLTTNLRCDNSFVEDVGWQTACENYSKFLKENISKKILFLELGVGSNTPGIIKYPFWQMTVQNKNAVYACLNYGEASCPKEIENQSICINQNIAGVLKELNLSFRT
ncbi:MAG: Sir2 silent information regulator family NAD-dependent deacetylase [Treponema sp.]|nr:Sir2 silent information regulator family NAD-dependent deacetylase [Spirochaetia bacterium]MDD7459408.1 Sir2 silent information regulator family NAD-dependent deacetylase [Spirochaetales bacterium]MDY5810517.1 Sir2 silent information regulator family NAD-dependent deacetylase [Treponema sp.]MEE1181960.1 Sir2 silent information regulator family NAD-dependent deacetylase [Treponema sp.]